MPRKKGGPAVLELTGEKYGQWTVLKKIHGSFWECQCSCGTIKMVSTGTLRMGSSKSCGCTSKNWCRRHGMERTATYTCWAAMKARCNNQQSNLYQNYGGRGIKLCDRWHDFINFYADMGEKPKGMTIDRIDVNGDYSPGNCRWADSKTQNRNRRNTKYLEYNGEKRPMAEWAELKNLKRKVLENRIRAGWEISKALETPTMKRS